MCDPCGMHRYHGCCPYGRLLELNRMCSCSSGVLAQTVSACDCFCRQNSCCKEHHCGCRRH